MHFGIVYGSVEMDERIDACTNVQKVITTKLSGTLQK